jgi:hypothetical protein
MLSNIRHAFQTVELDERELAPLVFGVGPIAGGASLGIVLGRVVGVLLNDRRLLRTWLTEAAELPT